MGKKLTIVVTCTDRKSRQPSAVLRAGSLPEGDGPSRARLWKKRLSDAPERVSLKDLYQGEAWTQSGRLVAAVEASGIAVRVLVASAGLGLQPVRGRFPAYAATFSPRHPDTVGVDLAERQIWWQEINGLLGGRSLGLVKGPVMVVLSDAYSKVLERDLEALTNRNPEVTMFGAHRDFSSATTIRSDKSLRSSLGGTVTSLNQRMAIQWLSLRPRGDALGSARHAHAWRQWVSEEQRPEIYDRQRMDDQAVAAWIRRARKTDPGLSGTAALSLLRSEGFACEQKRFKALFDRTGRAA
ncbi:MAG: hypothetical protein F2840_15750 [Actinobacteria bacterium]|uniref:Unannotated protein n=1 Tax=freshwater metagenome TaxID=449393 RepID=A0A6J7LU83_9ZZZZ|nr:hypothetical protein [Actinomycetota bacterium]